jgi:outer membrane protein assembly factor BamB
MVADENVVVIAYSSGEVYALRLENGHPLWSYSLTDTKGFDTRSLLMPIAAYPVIYQGYVFISSQGNKLICINLCSGKKVWEKEMVNIKEPIICGGYLYIIGNNRDLLCFYALTGKLIWKESLKQPTSIVEEKEKVILDKEEAPQDKKAEDQPKKEAEQDKMEKEEPVKWGIPLVINNQVFIPNAEGKGCYYSALTGQWVKEIDLPGPTFLPPLVLEDRVYFLSDNGLLSLWK